MKIQPFTVLDDQQNELTQEYFLKGKFVFYFYPKDNTPGCTKESCDFRDNYQAFIDAGFKVYGISKDSAASHVKFKQKFELPFPLLSDESLKMCKAFDVYKEKKFMGKTFMGIIRSTFVIVDGDIIHEYRNISVTDHIDNILKDIKS